MKYAILHSNISTFPWTIHIYFRKSKTIRRHFLSSTAELVVSTTARCITIWITGREEAPNTFSSLHRTDFLQHPHHTQEDQPEAKHQPAMVMPFLCDSRCTTQFTTQSFVPFHGCLHKSRRGSPGHGSHVTHTMISLDTHGDGNEKTAKARWFGGTKLLP